MQKVSPEQFILLARILLGDFWVTHSGMCQKSREFPIHTLVRYSVLSILFRTYSERPVRFGIPLSFVKVVELRRSLRKKKGTMLGIITYLTGRLVNSIKSSLPRPHPVGADNTTHHSRKADSLPFTAFGIIWKWQMQQCYNWASNFFNSSSSPNSFTN